ncbi:helix-turn-helix domain-containing protein [Sphingobacterium sp. N143]|uniref:helix-turn-helix domain-containing protein n=1 Tax=Sphingobacterium sp. N143 TaxID=2746727 RepID=UPI002576B4CE|nr:helix-turn-helix transcriptional regulator [Sphingobacterium sp. N143]MDM1295785.1 helix-turn-helix domain-containing protein [Sphingobacterium sp. N143]
MVKETSSIINEYHLNRYQPDKPQFALHDLKEYLKTNQCQAVKPHIHSFYQIIWFKKGIGDHSVDFKTYEVFDNALFFVAPNQVHYFDESTDYEGIMLHFNKLFLTQEQTPIDFFLTCNLFNNPYQQPSCCIGSDMDGILDRYILQIKDELENPETFGKEFILANYLKSFLIQIQRRKNQFERAADPLLQLFDEKRMQLVNFINLIDENYKKGYNVTDYARLLHMSSRSLSDLTHQQLNKTPSQMLQERIILEAQRLLLYSNLNINQVGYRLGFDDPSYFVKYFKKYTGASPSEFKKSIS